MDICNGLGGDCAERNQQAQAGMVATARGHDRYVPALHHLRRPRASGEIADQDRTGAWMEGDGHELFRFLAGTLTLTFMRLGIAHGIGGHPQPR